VCYVGCAEIAGGEAFRRQLDVGVCRDGAESERYTACAGNSLEDWHSPHVDCRPPIGHFSPTIPTKELILDNEIEGMHASIVDHISIFDRFSVAVTSLPIFNLPSATLATLECLVPCSRGSTGRPGRVRGCVQTP
jgi:hypothetical protein